MNKFLIRQLKNHYQARWAVLRHNQKNCEKILLINDLFVLKNLLPGTTLCYDCLGEVYQDIIPDLLTTVDQRCNNLVLINNIKFKYKTLDQISDYVDTLCDQSLLPKGRVILSFEHRFLIYNRVSQSVDSLIKNWTRSLKKFKTIAAVSMLGKAQPGYGDYFVCLEAND
jgi:hypothetical protein